MSKIDTVGAEGEAHRYQDRDRQGCSPFGLGEAEAYAREQGGRGVSKI